MLSQDEVLRYARMIDRSRRQQGLEVAPRYVALRSAKVIGVRGQDAERVANAYMGLSYSNGNPSSTNLLKFGAAILGLGLVLLAVRGMGTPKPKIAPAPTPQPLPPGVAPRNPGVEI